MVILLFASLAVLLVIGIPVAFSIAISVLIYVVASGAFTPEILVHRMVAGVDSFPLLALPLFIFAGYLMEQGSTRRLMGFIDSLVGHLPGGVAVADVGMSAFFASISGSGVATTAAVGAIMEPAMVERGYPKGFAAAIEGVSSALGIMIPPSITMIVFAIVGNVSVAAVFMAGIIPGIIIAFGLCLVAVLMSCRGNWQKGVSFQGWKWVIIKTREAVLPLIMPIVILGGILFGIFTPTEAAAVAVIYALILARFAYRDLSFSILLHIAERTIITSSMILFIMSAATGFAWIITIEQIPNIIAQYLLAITANSQIWTLLFIQLVLLILGTFMETIAIILITTPIFLPIAISVGMDPIVYGIVLTTNLMIGGNTPPLSVGLYTACSILDIPIDESVRYVIPFLICLLVSMLLFQFVPGISLFLPSLMGYN